MSQKKDSHIAIVGAGLVGSLMSIYLARRGYRVSVFERRPDMRRHTVDAGRSINLALSNRGIRALHEVGLDTLLRQNAIPMHGRTMHDVKGLLNFLPYGTTGQYINSVSRGGLNMALITEAEQQRVSFLFDQRCIHVDFTNTSLTLQHNGDTTTEKFDLILGADGAFSAVRGSMQFTDRFDFGQDYIEHGYKELHIPAGENGKFLLEKNSLHIWPRESFMMIALPNPDATFTCTLFLPFDGSPSFNTLKSSSDVQQFFEKYFPDVLAIMPTLHEDFQQNATSSLVTMSCYPWSRNKTLLIGDAAHAVVPFYGQGMNAGFEDCRILNALLDEHVDDWSVVLNKFQALRKPDADAIARLALDNFVEMRDLVADADFLLRKKIEAKLHALFPEKWTPLYSMVTFHDDMRYSDALKIGLQQRSIMDEVMKTPNIENVWQHLPYEDIVNRLG